MSKHKYIDKVCIGATVLSLILAIFFLCKGIWGMDYYAKEIGYESKLFDNSKVHTIDVVMDDWENFIKNCQREEYEICELTIDGETYKNVGIRGKGNTSLSNVSSMGSERYSFKVEFDQYDDTKSYYGLDKLSLNNIIQDNTYMKDYLTYQMMNAFDVDVPLCSFVYITVNGEDWGLYLAVEGIEDSFLQRNYGNDYGELYKPDSMSFGGGRGNGKDFDFTSFEETINAFKEDSENSDLMQKRPDGERSTGAGMGFSMGSSDVKLQYIDENPDSYSNIFDNAKTDITQADKLRLIQSLEILDSGEEIERVVDIDEVMRYFVVHNFVCNGDSYTGSMIHNYYLYEEDGKFSMIPWDYNLAYGTFQGGNATEEVNSPIDTPVSGGLTEDRPMVDWIFNDEKYTELYYQYFEEFLENVDCLSIIENAEELISEYVEKDPTKFCTYSEFIQGVKTLKEFCSLRRESIKGQLDGEIPSTTNGQQEDKKMLVDASHINLSDMGTMGNSMGTDGRGQENREKNQDMSQIILPENSTEKVESDEMSQVPDKFEEFPQMPERVPEDISEFDGEFSKGDFSQIKEEMQEFSGTMPSGTDMNTGGRELFLLGISICFLLIGLIIAFKFKGKN